MKKAIVMFVFVILLFGCIDFGGDQKPVDNETIEPKEEKVVVPSFTLTEPKEGAVFETEETYVDIILNTKDLIITSKKGTNKVGEGRFVLYLDGEKIEEIYSKRHTLEDVQFGEHTLEIELVHNNGDSYVPKISQTVSFTIKKKTTIEPAKTVEVKINDFSFDPEEITINVGDTVRWLNNANFPRSATDGTPEFNTETLAFGDVGEVTFDKPGEYEYFSANFTQMKGNVVVVEQD